MRQFRKYDIISGESRGPQMRNPFKFGKEVTGYQFYDREAVTRDLYRKLVDVHRP